MKMMITSLMMMTLALVSAQNNPCDTFTTSCPKGCSAAFCVISIALTTSAQRESCIKKCSPGTANVSAAIKTAIVQGCKYNCASALRVNSKLANFKDSEGPLPFGICLNSNQSPTICVCHPKGGLWPNVSPYPCTKTGNTCRNKANIANLDPYVSPQLFTCITK